MKTAQDIRSAFLSYFEGKGHRVVPSAPLVPHNDPTLMFTNAGMVPFKNVFTGQEKRPYTRAASSQKCVRAGGKHNDLDNVGFTARHHTFFEMLGNFSFGDYFKEDAIAFAWELVHKEFGLPKDRLTVTVYHEDDDAFTLWKKIAGLPDERIIRIATADNFWSMGDTGPCGPCSEIFYDHGADIPGGPPGSANEDGDRFIEIWNLVFMQYDQKSPDVRVPLMKTGIDTGMGLERLAAVLQGVHDNYDTDILRGLIEASAHLTGVDADGPQKVSHRVIADHMRSVSFLIADGVLPSNEGRGYVLRRIMRRAMRHANMLGARDPLLWRLVPTLVGSMGQAFPELARAEALVSETLKIEEERFQQTLERGLKLLSDEVARLGSGQPLPGEVAFKLYDTYGFPLDLTQDVLRAEGRPVDIAGFDAAMDRQKAEARKAWAGSGEAATDDVWFRIRDEKGASEFLGYTGLEAEGCIDALVINGTPASEATAGDSVILVANQTPFYGESGGQMGDVGVITSPDGARMEVTDTQKVLGDMILHIGEVKAGRFALGDQVHLAVDEERRLSLRANHSATHLLHAALRRRLGAHVTQKGSLVAPERLRFDFSHPKTLSPEDIDAIEADVNHYIRQNEDVGTRLMTPEDAQAAGAMALFGEKYGDEVRVVSMGRDIGEDEAMAYSMELCGGTHVRRTGDIGFFKIVSQGAISAGVRRIEALTGEAARRHVAQEEHQLVAAANVLKIGTADLPERLAGMVEDRRKMERELAEARRKLALSGGGAATSGPEVREVGGVRFLGQVLEGVSPKDLRSLIDDGKKTVGSGVVAFVAVADGKAGLAVGVTDDLTGRLNAVDMVRAGAQALGGKGGGGRPDMAQAGGPDAGKAPEALKAVEECLQSVTATA